MNNPLTETPRIKLMAYHPQDFERIYALYCDEDIIHFTTVNRQKMPDEDIKQEIQNIANAYTKHQGRYGKWLIVNKATNAIMGYAGLMPVAEIPGTEVTYALLKAYRGQGYATEAANALKDYAFNTLGLDTLYALIVDENAPSRTVVERMGMTTQKKLEAWGYTFDLYQISPKD